MRLLVRLLAGALGIVLVYLVVTAVQVWGASRIRQPRPSDAIVVLGAAQYDGRPSPALRARLDHAADLYERDLAPTVWVTGGQQPGDSFSEASASDLYLQRRGVPRDALQLEIHGANTYESLAATARFLRREDQRDVLLVSDRWHSYRLREIARELGLRPRVSPAESDLTSDSVRRLLRETLAVAVGRVLGYRRLALLDTQLSAPPPVAVGDSAGMRITVGATVSAARGSFRTMPIHLGRRPLPRREGGRDDDRSGGPGRATRARSCARRLRPRHRRADHGLGDPASAR